MLFRFFISLACVLLLSACAESESSVEMKTDISPVEVSFHAVRKHLVPRYYSATGYTNVSRSIEISTSQSATITELRVNEGELVEKGDLLVALDETELLSSIKRAESAIESAQIRLKDLAHDLDNSKQLRKKRVITAEQLRKASVQHNLAQTQLEQAQSELARQLARQPYHRINSPIHARVIKRWVNQGDLAVIGKPLLQLEAIGGLEFEAALPAKWAGSLHIGDAYLIKIHNRKAPVEALISHIVNSVDRATQTIQVKLALPDSEALEAGLSGQVDFVTGMEGQVLVDSSALVERGGVVGVFRIENNKARFTPVNFEREWQGYRVILSGLETSDTVINAPALSMKDGALVTVREKEK